MSNAKPRTDLEAEEGSEAEPEKKSKKKGKKGKGEPATDAAISISAHPVASYQVRRARGWGGLLGFAIVLLLSLHADVPPFDAGLRALAGGIAAHLGAWACAVAVWRRLVLAELEAFQQAREAPKAG